MNGYRSTKIVLMADDDPDDFYLVKEAWGETGIPLELRLVSDGVELMDYLNRSGKYADLPPASEPCLILLDLNMPRKDGREVLAELKTHESFKLIPVVVLTTSAEEADIQSCYNLGASSYLMKPNTFNALVDIMSTVRKYWLETVELPLSGTNPFLGFRNNARCANQNTVG